MAKRISKAKQMDYIRSNSRLVDGVLYTNFGVSTYHMTDIEEDDPVCNITPIENIEKEKDELLPIDLIV